MHTNFSLTDVIYRSMVTHRPDIDPLIEYLKMDTQSLNFQRGHQQKSAEQIADYLRRMGSNDIATLFRGEGVEYSEVVLDVAQKIGATDASESHSVETNEDFILRKLFADALDKMSDEEKRLLFASMGIKEGAIPFGSAGVIIVQFILKQFGGFATYRMSLIVANMVARAILGHGLSFATNAVITRTIGTMLGPIGWFATGLWLVIDLAGPAYRKTVPAVVHIAMLRQMLINRITIGVVGDGSSGKDSMIKSVFGIDTGNINPVAGSTKDAKIYKLGDSDAIQLVNYPGFNDIRQDVNDQTHDLLQYTDVFVMVVDITRGISQTEIEILKFLKFL
ncbi:MAG TPA: ubiquinol-cytochrome C chaperone family protein [Nitrosomonas sp.]|nr:ubiquinol-cytochrome C chaperone family protein [Nitrosomonas sp.]